MKNPFKQLTALLLSLAMVLSLASMSFAAEDNQIQTGASVTAADASEAQDAAQSADNDAQPEDKKTTTEEKAEEAAPETSNDSGEESAPKDSPAETNPTESDPADAGENSADAGAVSADGSAEVSEPLVPKVEAMDDDPGEITPAVICWQSGEEYLEEASFPFTGKEIKPAYRLMRDGQEVTKEEQWEEHWYTDEACTIPATEFVSVGTRYLCLTFEGKVMAQGSYTITLGRQKVTASAATISKKFEEKKTFSLNAKAKGKLSFSSSNPKVVKVNEKGVCTMVGAGKATITIHAAATDQYEAAEGKVEVALYKKAKNLGYSKSYKSGKYYKALAALKLSGTTRENIVDIALSQLGYKEGHKAGQMAGNGKGVGNWTEYGRFYGMNRQPWCAMFVNWCAREAGVSYSKVPKYAAVRYYHSWFKQHKCFHSWSQVRAGTYQPKKGDIIIYAYSKGGVAHHIGFVISSAYEGNKVQLTTVEGNTNDKVKKVNMSFTNKSAGKHGTHYILGVASPKY